MLFLIHYILPASILYIFKDLLILSVCIPIVGKFGITAAFAVLYIFTGELMPTVARNTGLGVCYLFASSGLIAFPYITYLVSSCKQQPGHLCGKCTFLFFSLVFVKNIAEEFNYNLSAFRNVPMFVPVSHSVQVS